MIFLSTGHKLSARTRIFFAVETKVVEQWVSLQCKQ